MNRLLITIAALSLCACQTAPLVPPTAAVIVLEGDTELDASYNVAANLYLATLPSMTPAVHDSVKPVLVQAYALVHAVDTGQVLAGETSLTAEIATASNLIAQVKAALTPATK
jgi:hypothetical protein